MQQGYAPQACAKKLPPRRAGGAQRNPAIRRRRRRVTLRSPALRFDRAPPRMFAQRCGAATVMTSTDSEAAMSQINLRHGIFLPPFHPNEENPTACLERDLDLIVHLDKLGFHEAWIGEHHSAGY